jgi:RTX calcium-binding nonapeptide repeat (4 copies)
MGLSRGDLLVLGPANDFLHASGSSGCGRIGAGPGFDTLRLVAPGPTSRISVKTNKNLVFTRAGSFGIRGLEKFVVSPRRAGAPAGSLRFFGGAGRQVVETIFAGRYTHLEVRPGAGADIVRLSTAARRSAGAVVTAGTGNDMIRGTNRPDKLIGNLGADRVDGRNGRDRCVAERERHCER